MQNPSCLEDGFANHISKFLIIPLSSPYLWYGLLMGSLDSSQRRLLDYTEHRRKFFYTVFSKYVVIL